jgi:hypothetical protein
MRNDITKETLLQRLQNGPYKIELDRHGNLFAHCREPLKVIIQPGPGMIKLTFLSPISVKPKGLYSVISKAPLGMYNALTKFNEESLFLIATYQGNVIVFNRYLPAEYGIDPDLINHYIQFSEIKFIHVRPLDPYIAILKGF